MTIETLRVRRLPKSKMQAIREYTNLRAFAEIGDDGSPTAYFIEVVGTLTANTNKRSNGPTKRSPKIDPDAVVGPRLGISERHNRFLEGSKMHRAFPIIMQLVPARRSELQKVLAEELRINHTQARCIVSEFLHRGKILEVVS